MATPKLSLKPEDVSELSRKIIKFVLLEVSGPNKTTVTEAEMFRAVAALDSATCAMKEVLECTYGVKFVTEELQ